MNQLFYNIASGNAEIAVFCSMPHFHFASVETANYKEYDSVCSWFKIQSLVTIKVKKEREKKNEKEKKRNNNRSHDWKKKAPKHLAQCCCVVAAFLCKAEWINEIAPKWTYENIFLKKSSNYRSKMWHKIDVSWTKLLYSSSKADWSCMISAL